MFIKTLLFLAFLSVISVDAQQSAPKTSFDDLLAKVKKDDRSVDFQQLRFAYTETAVYQPYGGVSDARKAMFTAMTAKDYEQVLQQSEKMLAANFLDINGQFGSYIANQQLGKTEKAAYHKYIVTSLLKSITDSGDGKSLDTAFVVISTDEEYALFNVLGLRPTNQALVADKDHHYDKMTAVNPKTEETVVYYFNIDRPYNWLGKSLKP